MSITHRVLEKDLHLLKLSQPLSGRWATELKQKHFIIDSIRGIGLMIGMQLTGPGKEIVDKCLENGLRINCTQGTVLRFMLPMIVTKEQIDQAIEIFDAVSAGTIEMGQGTAYFWKGKMPAAQFLKRDPQETGELPDGEPLVGAPLIVTRSLARMVRETSSQVLCWISRQLLIINRGSRDACGL